MTAPARTQQQPAATPLVDMSLLDKVIEQTIDTQDAHKRLSPFLPKGQSYDRIAAQLREAMIKVPLLAKCDPNTIIDAVVTIQRWRLEIGETAHLVPFKDSANNRYVCTPVRGYIGDIELLINNGLARRVDSFCVYEGEPFTYQEGTSPILEHRPMDPATRGKMLGAYAVLWQTYTNCKAVFLYMSEIEEIRQTYSKQWKSGACPPWYAKKCAVKAVTKLLPKTPKVRGVIEQMEDDDRVAVSATRGISIQRPAHVDDDGVDHSEAEDGSGGNSGDGREAHSRQDDATSSPSTTPGSQPRCPKCDGPVWDNRLSKTNPKAPDYKCRDKSCDGAIWPKRGNSAPSQGEIPGMGEETKRPVNAVAEGR